MSGKNNAKAELTAIYRLEFYRKQKNWKLFNQVKKQSKKNVVPAVPSAAAPDPSVKPKHALNETYNVSYSKTDAASLHNNAFIESDSNIAQCLEEEEITTVTTTKPPSNDNPPSKNNPPSNDKPQSNPPDTESCLKPATTRKPSRIWNIPWSELQEGWLDESRSGERGRGEDGWPATSEVWVQTPQTEDAPRDLCAGGEAGEAGGEGEAGEHPDADREWSVAEQLTCVDDYSFCEEQFMIGAHLGPHSTALSQSVEETAADAVRQLLQYAERHALPNTGYLARDPPPYNSSYEEYPTHDVGLIDPTLQTYSTMTHYLKPDLILGGSHKNYVHFDLESIPEQFGQLNGNIGQYDRNYGQYDRNVGQCDRNYGQYDRNVGQYDTNVRQNVRNVGQYNTNVDQNYRNVGQYDNVGQGGKETGQYDKNVGQYDQYDKNVCQYDRNIVQYTKIVNSHINDRKFGQNYQNTNKYDTNILQYDCNLNQFGLKFEQYDSKPDLRRTDVNNNGCPIEGRGRGRIRNEVNVIAIGKGRPYRV